MLRHVDIAELPESVQDLIEVVGLSAAEVIVRERGGIRLCIPMKAKANHWMAKLIGLDKMVKLVRVYQGEEIDIPRCAAAILAARENEIACSEKSNAELAREHGYTERGIRKLKRRVEGNYNARQDELF